MNDSDANNSPDSADQEPYPADSGAVDEAPTEETAGDDSGFSLAERTDSKWIALDIGTVLGIVLIGAWVVPQLSVDHETVNTGLTVLGVIYVAWSLWRDGIKLGDMGVRTGEFLQVLLVSAVPVVFVLGPYLLGTLMGGYQFDFGGDFVRESAGYLAWACAQQFAAIGIFWRHFISLYEPDPDEPFWQHDNVKAAGITAVVFSLVHLPNPGLTLLTLVAEFLWLVPYFKKRNIFALAVVHALTAQLVSETLVGRSDFLPNLKVGWGFFQP